MEKPTLAILPGKQIREPEGQKDPLLIYWMYYATMAIVWQE
jgi:hypothetical protein